MLDRSYIELGYQSSEYYYTELGYLGSEYKTNKFHESTQTCLYKTIGVRLVCDRSAFIELGFGICEYYYTELGYMGSEFCYLIIG